MHEVIDIQDRLRRFRKQMKMLYLAPRFEYYDGSFLPVTSHRII